MVKQYKNTFILIGAIIIVTIAAVTLPRLLRIKKNTTAPSAIVPPPTPCLEGERFNTSTGELCPSSTPSEKVTNTAIQATTANGISYEGKVFVVEDRCVMQPSTLSIAKGDRIMISNTATTPVTITRAVDTKDTLTLKPLRYATRSIVSTETFFCTTPSGEKGTAIVTVTP